MPLKGTCVAWMPAMLLNSSATKWVDEAMPPEEKFIEPGLAFAWAMSSFPVFGPLAAVTSTEATFTVVLMPAKSFRMS